MHVNACSFGKSVLAVENEEADSKLEADGVYDRN